MASLNFLAIIAIIAIAINSETSDGARILGIFPVQGKSHAILGEQMMKILANKGHQVDVVSHFPLKKLHPNYKDLSLQGSLEIVTNNVNYSMVADFSSPNIKQLMEFTGYPVCELLKLPVLQNIIKNPPTNPPYDLVIVEYFTAHCYLAFGRLLNVPMIGVTASVLLEWQNEPLGNPSSLAFVPGGFTDFSTKMNFWERLQNVVLSKLISYQFNDLAERQKEYIDKYIGPGYPSIYELSKELSLLLVNSHHSLNGVKPMTPGIVEIGGMHVQDNGETLIPELQQWLDESKHGCIYVSFGSMVKIESFPKKTLEAFYASFKNIAPVRVLMKIAKKEELPPGLPKNVKTHHWLPQIQVLKHKNVKAFVTHGGLLGTIESIYYAVPMVGFPLFGDQGNNMKNYEKKKIAITLDYASTTEKKFTAALTEILKNSEIRSNIEKLSILYKDRPVSPQDAVVFWVEYVLRHGNILKSPAVNLSWYQVELLDVYGFVLLILLLLIYIVFFMIRTLLKCICKTKMSDKDILLSKKRK